MDTYTDDGRNALSAKLAALDSDDGHGFNALHQGGDGPWVSCKCGGHTPRPWRTDGKLYEVTDDTIRLFAMHCKSIAGHRLIHLFSYEGDPGLQCTCGFKLTGKGGESMDYTYRHLVGLAEVHMKGHERLI